MGRHGRAALVTAFLWLGACQDQTLVSLLPSDPAPAAGASGGAALGGSAGTAAVAGTATAGGAGSAGMVTGGAGMGGTAGTQTAAGSSPVGEAGASGEPAEAGEGGAGPVAGEGGAAGVAGHPVQLVHRYDFSGTGSVVRDLAGGADGTFMNGTLTGDGFAELNGLTQYIALPAGIVSALTNATFVMWIEWTGTGQWERIFDFGNNDGPEREPPQEIGNGLTTFWLTPRNVPGSGNMAEAQIGWQPAPNRLYGSELGIVFPSEPIQVAVVIDADQTTLSIHLNGELLLRAAYPDSARMVDLSVLVDDNNWLGRSQWSQDDISNFEGVYDEFRIYATALDDAYIAESFALGPDVLPE